ncbi:sulfite reductase (NADPH) hemoprotein beta-component [Rhizomicrobium palustre]|uniref:Sulfite reductase (NADPH) hemoprotein beta-component n=1 Tax=Rhizomicrobium palustre TaxID=189966 RepID=A0A846MX77_9PROT|nr:nitrite/sulfite reductase [Rhizomicrobium palustre]NIK87662.1 sulfite reductase (NADPH) hemoprotein beta-component [Rhizomicrobium palustre]
MYRYDEFDAKFVAERTEQFRFQVERRLKGELTEDQFKPFRLMNGLYLQLHAYMLRVAVPYGTLSARQLKKLAHIARVYDKGYGHFTTRQNIQYNWPKLKDVPDILAELAEVEMHAIQTSGNCIRNVTADHFAGAAADEIEDPRPVAEIIRQWSSLHPEFTFLPRKFKVAVSGAKQDRAALQYHDLAVEIVENEEGRAGYRILVGGGMGRTPYLALVVGEFVEKQDLLAYLEAVLRVYNENGRRDNIYKARIKILAHALGESEMRDRVLREFMEIKKAGTLQVPDEERARIESYFAPPEFEALDDIALPTDGALGAFVKNNVAQHKAKGYAIVTISLKPIGGVPGDISHEQLDGVAQLMEDFGYDEIRASHEQNLVLPHVKQKDIPSVFARLEQLGLATPNAGLISDIICCPGLDYCDLANARSIPIAQEIAKRFGDQKRQEEIGELKIKMSGCINACGHHHAGHIGILGVDKKGVEYYQLLLGGSGAEDASIGTILGPGFGEHEIVDAVERVVNLYLKLRKDGERFLDTTRRVGIEPFKQIAYQEQLHAAY